MVQYDAVYAKLWPLEDSSLKIEIHVSSRIHSPCAPCILRDTFALRIVYPQGYIRDERVKENMMAEIITIKFTRIQPGF